MVEVSTP